MPRSRLCALALLPLLVAGAAACGGDDRDAERRAAADAAFRSEDMFAATCVHWRDASPAVRGELAGGAALRSTRDGTPRTADDMTRVLDDECAAAPAETTFVGVLLAVGFEDGLRRWAEGR